MSDTPSHFSAERQFKDIPHAIDAERAVLGALLVNNESFTHVEDLKENCFYDKRHQILFSEMQKIYEHQHVDSIVLVQRLKDLGNLADVGGDDYIAELSDIGTLPGNMPAYVEILKETAFLRQIINCLTSSIYAAYKPGEKTAQKVLDETETRISDIHNHLQGGRQNLYEAKTLAHQYLDKMQKIANTGDFSSIRGTPSGYEKLDYFTAGLHGGELIVLAGRPGSGKTAFALNLVRNIARSNYGVLCLSLEMSASQLVSRMVSHYGINTHKLRTYDRINVDDLSKMTEAVSALGNLHIYIDDSSILNILEARTRSRRVHRQLERQGVPLGLIMVDYLQLMEAENVSRNENRAQEVSVISRGLKALAKELNVPVLALSQLNRSIETRAEKRPQPSDLRESGAIEQDADLILFLHHEEKGSDTINQDTTNVDLIIGKQRNGPTGTIHFSFEKNFSRFTPIDPRYETEKTGGGGNAHHY